MRNRHSAIFQSYDPKQLDMSLPKLKHLHPCVLLIEPMCIRPKQLVADLTLTSRCTWTRTASRGQADFIISALLELEHEIFSVGFFSFSVGLKIDEGVGAVRSSLELLCGM